MSSVTPTASLEGNTEQDRGSLHIGLKRAARRLVIELVAAIALVSFGIDFPHGLSFTEAWRFVFTHPLVLLHVAVGTLILVEAIVYLVRVMRVPRRSWVVLAASGLAFILLAYAAGEIYVATQQNTVLTYKSLGWFGALVTYGIGWYRGRDRARP